MSNRAVVISVVGLLAVLLVVGSSLTIVNGFEIGLNIVRSISSLGTFLVALYLFDRFGLDKDIKSRQMSAVLELADSLRDITIMAHGPNASYFLSFRSDQLDHSSNAAYFASDKNKRVYADFSEMEKELHPVLSFREDMMIPEEIKSKLGELDPVGSAPLKNLNPDEDLILLRFSGEGQKEQGNDQQLGLIVPETTLEEYCVKLENVTQAVQDWVQENSQVGVDIEQ